MRVWVARDSKGSNDDRETYYVLGTSRPRKGMWNGGDGAWHGDIDVCPKMWEKAGGMKLKPGDEPIRVELTVSTKRIAKKKPTKER